MTTQEKYQHLQQIFSEMQSVLIAFSGGVDSTLLAKAAHDTLGDRAQAVTAWSQNFPEIHEREFEQLVRAIGIRHDKLLYDELSIPYFCENTPERCYVCKRYLFERFAQQAKALDLQCVADGSNADDVHDFRPGMRALRELGIRSPLREVGLSKPEIRMLSQQMNLPTWNKPSMPCLATRIPYGTEITRQALNMVAHAEQFLAQFHFAQVRVRHHDPVARIEVTRADMQRMFDEHLDEIIVARFKEIGYIYITLDLQGFRSGSMNEILQKT